jgi:hypothetical protein
MPESGNWLIVAIYPDEIVIKTMHGTACRNSATQPEKNFLFF